MKEVKAMLKHMALAVLGTVLFPFFLAGEGKSKVEKIALFCGGLIAIALAFPVFAVVSFVELREKENKKKKEVPTESLLMASPLGMTLLALLLGRKR
ncbi:MAG: hypothetical protein QXU09_01625 [Thermoproteota archaeon]